MNQGRKESARIRKSVWYVCPYRTTLCAKDTEPRMLGCVDKAKPKPGARLRGQRILMTIHRRERERRSQAAGLWFSYRM